MKSLKDSIIFDISLLYMFLAEYIFYACVLIISIVLVPRVIYLWGELFTTLSMVARTPPDFPGVPNINLVGTKAILSFIGVSLCLLTANTVTRGTQWLIISRKKFNIKHYLKHLALHISLIAGVIAMYYIFFYLVKSDILVFMIFLILLPAYIHLSLAGSAAIFQNKKILVSRKILKFLVPYGIILAVLFVFVLLLTLINILLPFRIFIFMFIMAMSLFSVWVKSYVFQVIKRKL